VSADENLKLAERVLALLERLIALIRPKAYNFIARLVVGAGVALLTSPWWLEIVNALASKYLQITLPSSSGQVVAGLICVVAGLLYHFAVHYVNELIVVRRELAERIVELEHDRRMFEGLSNHLDESGLDDILYVLRTQHAYWSAQSTALMSGAHYLTAPASQFLSPVLKELGNSLADSLQKLSSFIAFNFYAYGPRGEDGYRFCLQPSLNADLAEDYPSDEQQDRYDKFSTELEDLADEVEAAYVGFRAGVKKTLAV